MHCMRSTYIQVITREVAEGQGKRPASHWTVTHSLTGKTNRLPPGGMGVRGESYKDCSIMQAGIVCFLLGLASSQLHFLSFPLYNKPPGIHPQPALHDLDQASAFLIQHSACYYNCPPSDQNCM